MFVCCECCVLSGRGLCDGMITRPEDSDRLWRVVVCDQETSNEEAKARYGAVENTTNRFATSRKPQTTVSLNKALITKIPQEINPMYIMLLRKCTVLCDHGRLRLKCDGTSTKTRFLLSAKRTSPFKSAGASVQSTTGSRGVDNSVSNAGYTMFRGSVKSTSYPLHSPIFLSLPLPCVTVCHHILTGL
jgi:hypothetical protein